jgi:hypothetical protein
LTHNEALEHQLHWSPDGKQYEVDVDTGKVHRLGADFNGSWADTCTAHAKVLGLGQLGTEVQTYSIDDARARKLEGCSGSYEGLTSAKHSPRILFRHSAIGEPTELYLAEDVSHLASAK